MKCDYCRTYAKGERCPNCGAPRLSPDWADMSATAANLDLSSFEDGLTSITALVESDEGFEAQRIICNATLI